MGSFLRNRLNRTYAEHRDIESGIDPALSDAALNQFVLRKVVEKVRAIVHGCPSAFLGRRTRIQNRQYLTMGSGVVIGDFVEIVAMAHEGIVLGDKCTLDRLAVLRGSGGVRRLGVGIRFGDRVSVGVGAIIHGGGGVRVGNNTMIGPYTGIFTENHLMRDPDTPVIEQGQVGGPVVMDEDVFLGAGAKVLGPCTIGKGAVIAAGSIVTGDVEPLAIVAGIPARVIGRRGAKAKSDAGAIGTAGDS